MADANSAAFKMDKSVHYIPSGCENSLGNIRSDNDGTCKQIPPLCIHLSPQKSVQTCGNIKSNIIPSKSTQRASVGVNGGKAGRGREGGRNICTSMEKFVLVKA